MNPIWATSKLTPYVEGANKKQKTSSMKDHLSITENKDSENTLTRILNLGIWDSLRITNQKVTEELSSKMGLSLMGSLMDFPGGRER
jgi:hypothetical protein